MVVYWAFESIDKILNQSASADLTFELGKEEQALLELLRFKKRRDEWLAGRLALKKLLTKVVPEFSGLEPFRLQIVKAESGAPTLLLDSTQPAQISISLSHSNGYLLCAVSQLSPNMGVDLELIETRSEAFISDYFTETEIEQINRQPMQDRALLSTLLWSGKEAVLKALSVGLKLDTRRIEINLVNFHNSDEWQSNSVFVLQEKSLRLLWRRQDNFVFTFCAEDIRSSDLVKVSL